MTNSSQPRILLLAYPQPKKTNKGAGILIIQQIARRIYTHQKR